ncbi:ankyrin [Nemania diffusa]|nr:ankyrin [Nemania diffusa]
MHPEKLQAAIIRWEDAATAIDSALNRLHFLAAAIRKSSAKQLEYNVATFLSEYDILFHKDAVLLVRWRFPSARKGLCQQLGDSIAVRRRMLLQKHHHAKKLTVRRRMVRQLNVPPSGTTKASRPDPHAPALRQIHLPKRPALTTLISAVSTSHADSFEYPPQPRANLGESRVQCPYCLMPLDNVKLQDRRDEYWRHHVNEDLKPYSCLFPECAESLLFFTHRKEDWPRKVHTVIWYCDIDHEPPERFETEWEWRKHMKDPSSHPKRKFPTPSKAQLDAILPSKKQVALRDRFVCPLLEKADDQMPDMQEFLLDHIASHIKSLSLMSLPCLDISSASPGENEQSLNEGSVPKPPSGIDYIGEASLPSNTYDYKHPDIPPDQSSDEWLEICTTWKGGSVRGSHETPESDPILAHLMKAQKAHHESRIWRSDLELKDGSGRTMLSFAAERGEVALVKSLLSQGVDIETTDQTGRTPLLWAAACGKAEVVKLLIESGAEIEAIDQEYGRTPFSWTAAGGHMAVAEVLLTRGACMNTTDNSGRNPFEIAATRGGADIMNILLATSAHINKNNPRDDQETLSWAAAIGRESIVRALLDRGTNIETRDEEHHQTPLSLAAARGHESVVELLLEKGSEIETRDKKHGRTPLSLAAEGGHISVVMLLLKKGSNIEARDRKYGRTPLSWAAKNGHVSVVDALALTSSPRA